MYAGDVNGEILLLYLMGFNDIGWDDKAAWTNASVCARLWGDVGEFTGGAGRRIGLGGDSENNFVLLGTVLLPSSAGET